jgi:hypothetical protein
MDGAWLILLLAGAALLPVAVAAGILALAFIRGQIRDLGMPLAFGKAMALGVAAGLTVSALVLALVLSVVRLAGR